mmetsp:Transcript_38532/g.96981  ORF Transcript_38532/g.96981 Transcript_38532/m.96981 type:complete len:225 (+) Transcript_38532:346-1020(+)
MARLQYQEAGKQQMPPEYCAEYLETGVLPSSAKHRRIHAIDLHGSIADHITQPDVPFLEAWTEYRQRTLSVSPVDKIAAHRLACVEPDCVGWAVPPSDFCFAHLVRDPKQHLFKKCSYTDAARDYHCEYPVFVADPAGLCVAHTGCESSSTVGSQMVGAKRKRSTSSSATGAAGAVSARSLRSALSTPRLSVPRLQVPFLRSQGKRYRFQSLAKMTAEGKKKRY